MYLLYDLVGSGIGLLILLAIVNAIGATVMSKVATRKGYGEGSSHPWLICFLFGVVGWFYVIGLPDLYQEEREKTIIKLLQELKDK